MGFQLCGRRVVCGLCRASILAGLAGMQGYASPLRSPGLSFLPYLFGLDFLYAEASVYALAKKMMPEYEGGFWHFIRLPDGGGYMMPDGDRFHMVNGANWFDRTVSADAAGIILSSLVINRQLWLYHDSGDAGLTQLYRMRDAQLWRHIEFHPECNAIYAALD
ncbi:putative antirestriction protein [Escherichia coli]|nr:putative antirestriction protein [Escherichia coli]